MASLHLAAMAAELTCSSICTRRSTCLFFSDRSGRNILHAAISHRRYHVVDWLINDVADNLIDYHGRKQLFQMVDPKRGLPPFLAAATDLDYDLLVAFIGSLVIRNEALWEGCRPAASQRWSRRR